MYVYSTAILLLYKEGLIIQSEEKMHQTGNTVLGS